MSWSPVSLLKWAGTNLVDLLANTSLARHFVKDSLAALNKLLARPLSAEQIKALQFGTSSVHDLVFDATAVNDYLGLSPLIVSQLWVRSISLQNLNCLSIDTVILVMKWNPSFALQRESNTASNGPTQTTGEAEQPEHNALPSPRAISTILSDVVQRYLNLFLHRFTLKVTNLCITVESPREDGTVDLLRFSLGGELELAQTDQFSNDSAMALSLSAIKRSVLRKRLRITGHTRLELYNEQAQNIGPQYHFPGPHGPRPAPLLFSTTQEIGITIEAVPQDTLSIRLGVNFGDCHFALHHTQLSMLSNIKRRLEHTFVIRESTQIQEVPSAMAEQMATPSNSSIAPLLTYAERMAALVESKYQFIALEEDDSDDSQAEDAISSALIEKSVVEAQIAPMEIPPVPSATTICSSINLPKLSFVMLPNYDNSPETSPFISSEVLLDPATTGCSFIQMIVSGFDAMTSPTTQQVRCKEITIREIFAILPQERSYVPQISHDMIPTEGYYTLEIFAAEPHQADGCAFDITQSTAAPLQYALGHVKITLPLALPKLCAIAWSDWQKASREHDKSIDSENDTWPPLPAKHSSDASPRVNLHGLVDSHDSIGDQHNLPQDLLFKSLLGNNPANADPAAPLQATVSIHSAKVNLEVPLPRDIEFVLPLVRRERLVLEVKEVFAHLNASRPGSDSASAFQRLSLFFSELNVDLEEEFFKKSRQKLSRVLRMEAQSANGLDSPLTPLLIEWRASVPLPALSSAQIKHSPFAVPGSQMGAAFSALSTQDFAKLLNETPAKFILAMHVHAVDLHLSQKIYSHLMGTYDTYIAINPSAPFKQASEPAPNETQYSFQARFGGLSLIPNELETHYFQLEDLSAYQTPNFLGLNKSFLVAQFGSISMSGVHSIYSMKLDQQGPQRSIFYASCNESFTVGPRNLDVEPKVHSQTNVLVETADLVVSWCRSDRWPSDISSIFDRTERMEYQSQAMLERKKAAIELNKMAFFWNAVGSSFSIWDSYSPSTDVAGSKAPRSVPSPQIVIVPVHLFASMDFSTYLTHAHFDVADVFTCLDLGALKEPPLGKKLDIPRTSREYWLMRKHSTAGKLATTTLTCEQHGDTFEARLKFGCHLSTTPMQLAALQLLVSAILSRKSEFQVKIAAPRPIDDNDPEEKMTPVVPLRVVRPAPLEPQVHWELAHHLDPSIVNDVYVPEPPKLVPLRTRLVLASTSIEWDLRVDEVDTDARNKMCLLFSHVEGHYECDANDSSIAELFIKTVNGWTNMGDKVPFFVRDLSCPSFRPNTLSFSLVSCRPGFEASAPRSHNNSLILPRVDDDYEHDMMQDGKELRLQLFVLPMELILNVQTFRLLASYYYSYSNTMRLYDPPAVSGAGSSFIESFFALVAPLLELPVPERPESPPNQAQIEARIIEDMQGPLEPPPQEPPQVAAAQNDESSENAESNDLFKSVYIGDMHLKLTLLNLDGAKVRLPSFMSKNVLGWGGLARAMEIAYAPFFTDALSSILVSFPGFKLVRIVGDTVYQLATVPRQEAEHGRSVTYGILSTLGVGLKNLTAETLSLTAQASAAAYKSFAFLGSYLWSPTEPQAAEPASVAHQPLSLQAGASIAAQSVMQSLQDTSSAISLPIDNFKANGSYLLLIRDSAIAAPAILLLPTAGALKGLTSLFQGAASHIQNDHVSVIPTAQSSQRLADDAPFIPSDLDVAESSNPNPPRKRASSRPDEAPKP